MRLRWIHPLIAIAVAVPVAVLVLSDETNHPPDLLDRLSRVIQTTAPDEAREIARQRDGQCGDDYHRSVQVTFRIPGGLNGGFQLDGELRRHYEAQLERRGWLVLDDADADFGATKGPSRLTIADQDLDHPGQFAVTAGFSCADPGGGRSEQHEPAPDIAEPTTSMVGPAQSVPVLFSSPPMFWGGVVEFLADGSIRADRFNEHLVDERPSWVGEPRAAALVLFDIEEVPVPPTLEPFLTPSVKVEDNTDGTTTISITVEGPGDDSIAGSRRTATFERAMDGTVRLVSGTWAFRCHRTASPEAFEPMICP